MHMQENLGVQIFFNFKQIYGTLWVTEQVKNEILIENSLSLILTRQSIYLGAKRLELLFNQVIAPGQWD